MVLLDGVWGLRVLGFGGILSVPITCHGAGTPPVCLSFFRLGPALRANASCQKHILGCVFGVFGLGFRV